MDPRSIRHNSTMPAFAAHRDADKLVDKVIAYLKAMAGREPEPGQWAVTRA